MKKATKTQHQTNKIGEEILTNCETYLTRMKNRKMEKSKPEQNPTFHQMNLLRPLVKNDVPVEKTVLETEVPAPPQKLLHKEAFNSNMATVEVTVRTAPDVTVRPAPKQTKSKVRNYPKEKQETWDQLLVAPKSNASLPGSFALFDPLRTLHFLSKELQLKLQLICPDDLNIHQIVTDMLHAMQRLPPDIVSQFQCNRLKKPSTITELPVRDEPASVEKLTKGIQVKIEEAVTEKLHKKLEESASKLEANCKQMEKGYMKLCEEKDDLLMQLQIEKENVKSLKKILDERVTEKPSKIEEELEKLHSDRKALRAQVKHFEAQLKLQSNTQSAELRTLIQQLRDKQLMAEQDSKNIKNELDVMKLEKEKLLVLLDYKDRELQDLHANLENVHTVVAAALTELRSKSHVSRSSSLSALTEVLNIPLSKIVKDIQPLKDVMNKYDTVFKTVSSGDTGFPSILSEMEEDFIKENCALGSIATSTPVYDLSEKTSSIRKQFDELKQDALNKFADALKTFT